ncbi:MAG: hypothetical protein VB082_03115 [Christensenella sp.]|nr:hypothetical protein [Christensenella sp.]
MKKIIAGALMAILLLAACGCNAYTIEKVDTMTPAGTPEIVEEQGAE